MVGLPKMDDKNLTCLEDVSEIVMSEVITSFVMQLWLNRTLL